MDSEKVIADYMEQHGKSKATAFILAFLFGPLGLCYVSWVMGLIGVVAMVATASTIVAPIIIWIGCMCLAIPQVEARNKKIEVTARLMAGR